MVQDKYLNEATNGTNSGGAKSRDKGWALLLLAFSLFHWLLDQGIFPMYDECLCASIDMRRLESHYGGLVEPCADTRILVEAFRTSWSAMPSVSSRDRIEGSI